MSVTPTPRRTPEVRHRCSRDLTPRLAQFYLHAEAFCGFCSATPRGHKLPDRKPLLARGFLTSLSGRAPTSEYVYTPSARASPSASSRTISAPRDGLGGDACPSENIVEMRAHPIRFISPCFRYSLRKNARFAFYACSPVLRSFISASGRFLTPRLTKFLLRDSSAPRFSAHRMPRSMLCASRTVRFRMRSSAR